MANQIQGKPTPVRWVGRTANLPPEERLALLLGNAWQTSWDYMLFLGAAEEASAVKLGAPFAASGDINVWQSGSEAAAVQLGAPTAAYFEAWVWQTGSEASAVQLGAPVAAYDYMILVAPAQSEASAVILGTPTPANG